MSARNGVRARKNKERSKNFSELEKRTVLELISKHREVLRQGRSNNAANKSKQLVWSQICAEVNNRCRAECPRTPAQVKMWYENYKKKCKMRHIEPGTEESPPINIDNLIWRNITPLADSVVKDERIEPAAMMETPDEHLPLNMSNDRLDERNMRDIDPMETTQLIVPRDHIHIASVRSPDASSPVVKQESPFHHSDSKTRNLLDMTAHTTNPCFISQDSTSNIPLNLSHLEPNVRIDTSSPQEDARDSSPSFSNTINFSSRSNLPSSQIYPNKKYPKPRPYYSRAGNSQENGFCDRTTTLESVSPHNYHHNNNNNVGNNFCPNTSPTEEEKLYYLTKRQHAIYEHDLRMKTLNMELKNKEEVFSLQKQLFLIELKLKMDFLEKNSNQ